MRTRWTRTLVVATVALLVVGVVSPAAAQEIREETAPVSEVEPAAPEPVVVVDGGAAVGEDVIAPAPEEEPLRDPDEAIVEPSPIADPEAEESVIAPAPAPDPGAEEAVIAPAPGGGDGGETIGLDVEDDPGTAILPWLVGAAAALLLGVAAAALRAKRR